MNRRDKRLANVIGKAVFCLFLMFASVTHALAEPGVTVGSHTPLTVSTPFEPVSASASEDPHSTDEGSSKESSLHHAAHDVTRPDIEPNRMAFWLSRPPFPAPIPEKVPASHRAGPERPPRA